MSNINFNCDVCGREVQGYTFVNGMKFCAKCYQETFGGTKDWQLLDKDKTIAYLQSQLAEKEKEIDNLYNRLNSKEKFYEMSLEKDYKHYLSQLDKLEKQCDKEKISFCIKQLEKVKEEFGYKHNSQLIISSKNLVEFINQQINELKGKVEE